jgi:hypothetical protein
MYELGLGWRLVASKAPLLALKTFGCSSVATRPKEPLASGLITAFEVLGAIARAKGIGDEMRDRDGEKCVGLGERSKFRGKFERKLNPVPDRELDRLSNSDADLLPLMILSMKLTRQTQGGGGSRRRWVVAQVAQLVGSLITKPQWLADINDGDLSLTLNHHHPSQNRASKPLGPCE